MPRRSAASLSVIRTELPQRPSAPVDLSKQEAALWKAIVDQMPIDFFIVGSLPLLAQYVRHVEAANRIAQMINGLGPHAELALRSKLSEMSARETKAMCSLATKLRLAPSNRYDSKKRIPVTNASKPWEQYT
jgi:hypothetical protein